MQFDSIRPYISAELPNAISRLINTPIVFDAFKYYFPKVSFKEYTQMLSKIKTIEEFQEKIFYPITKHIFSNTTTEFSHSGLDKLNPKENYIFISNHQDIVIDPIAINYVLLKEQFNTTEIAIGNNLLIEPWITDIVKLNRCFVVKRDLNKRELLLFSKELSEYIHYSYIEKQNSIWIAQREGRAKDGNDKTNPAIIRMLAMACNNSFKKLIEMYKIVPVCFSYEYDACDSYKALDILMDRPKTAKDDFDNMHAGITKNKGRIHVHFAEPITHSNNEMQAANIAQIIDKSIYCGYKLFENNYYAYDQITGKNDYLNKYTKNDVESFETYLENIHKLVAQINKNDLKQFIYSKYAYPIKNKQTT